MGSSTAGRVGRTDRGLWATTAAVVVVIVAVLLTLGDGLRPTTGPATSARPSERPVIRTPTPGPTIAPLPTSGREIAIATREIRAPLVNRIGASGVWTGSEVIVWGGWTEGEFGLQPPRANGAAYSPETDRWRRIARAPIPGRARHVATWTGEEMLVWGGYPQFGLPRAVGAAYDAAADRWRMIQAAPIGWSSESLGAWTGREWVIARRTRADRIQLAAYDPDRDRWRRLPTPGVELSSEAHLVWCGETLLVGSSMEGLFRLKGDTWTATASPPDGMPATGTPICAAGRLFIPLGSAPGTILGEWDATADTWRRLPAPPSGRSADVRWWNEDGSVVLGADAAFDLGAETWWTVAPPIEDSRSDAARVWTGTELVVWGGWYGHVTSEPFETGLVLTPNW